MSPHKRTEMWLAEKRCAQAPERRKTLDEIYDDINE
jgi:hypothetical protein